MPKILLVEDDADLRRVLVLLLERSGYAVTVAASAEEALARLGPDADGHDLVVTDVEMAGLSGWDLAAAVLDRRPGTSVVVMSGAGPGRGPLADPHLPGVRFLAKPFPVERLLEAVRGLVGPAVGTGGR